MAQSARTGRGMAGDIGRFKKCHDWPGREFGIRQPDAIETPLSWAEVKSALNSIRQTMGVQ